jgi:NADPH2:quinone reductase
VIVTAAGGGVGSIAIQLAKIKGAETIIGLTGSMQKADLIHSLGATAVIDYRSDNWLDQLDALTKKKGADLILESVGGDIGSALFTRLAPGGTMVVYGFSSGKLASIDMQSLVISATRVVGARLITASEVQKQQWANELVQWIRTGQLKTPITSYSLADVAQAHADMENRSTTGRVILLTRVTI